MGQRLHLERRFLQDDVGVGAGEAEGADAGASRPPVALPGPGFVHHLDGQALPGNVRRRSLEVEVLRQQFMLQRQDDFDQPAEPAAASR